MGSPEVDEASLSLDEKLLRFMEQLELMQEKRVALNTLIEQGWISMSSARYSMGNKHVSALQYASEMDPLVCVQVSTSDSGDVEFITERTTLKCSNVCEPAPTAIEEIGPQEQGVRRRNIPKKDVPTKEKSDDTCREKTSEVNLAKTSEHSPQQDPLKWFGILVPQSLKQAQSSFKQVIELSAEIASLQTAILRTRQELKISLTNKNAVAQFGSSEDMLLCRCTIQCRDVGHFHCPLCTKTIIKKSDMEKHLDMCSSGQSPPRSVETIRLSFSFTTC